MRDKTPLSGAELIRAREALIAAAESRRSQGRRPGAAADLRLALTELYELWLVKAAETIGITADNNIALIAVGSFARRDIMPYSDLDLVILHDGGKDVGAVAEALWYPLWDTHIGLDHSVRTVSDTLRVAQTDMTAALGLLDARLIAGDAELAELAIAGVRRQWRQKIADNFDPLLDEVYQRWHRAGYIAHRMDPDLKNGRGGPRDIQYLRALSAAQLVDRIFDAQLVTPGQGVEGAYRCLLDVRTELHLTAGRGRDIMHPQDADDIARRIGDGDRFDLARQLSDAARTIAFATEVGIRTARNALPRRGLARFRAPPVRRPLDEGVVEHNGEVGLARAVQVARDGGLSLRVAAAAARSDLPIGAATLRYLADFAPELKDQWNADIRDDLFTVLSSGRRAEAVIEALDRSGLWARLFPEWGPVRDLPPRDPAHVYTVDRHLVQTTIEAGRLAAQVHRPDLLLLAALFHDIGKGRGGDHSLLGARLMDEISGRLGIAEPDREILHLLVHHHLLLVSTAMNKDLEDPATAAAVAQAIAGRAEVLELLVALSEADARATGPGVWNTWKQGLIYRLAANVRAVLGGQEQLPPTVVVDSAVAATLAPGAATEAAAGGGAAVAGPTGTSDELAVRLESTAETNTFVLTLSGPDLPGLLSKAALVWSFHGLAVRHADVTTVAGRAADRFVVSTLFGSPPSTHLLLQDLRRALAGGLEPARGRPNRPAGPGAGAPVRYEPRIIWSPPPLGASPREWSLEVRTADQAGLLGTIAGVLESFEVAVRWATVDTFGSLVVDTFGVDLPNAAQREQLTARLVAALPPAEPEEDPEGPLDTHRKYKVLRRKPRANP